ncbi:MAG: integrase family protein [Acidobacteria bacterium]|nr:integrase family protein [Acidobacteriota bacterium]
MAGRLRAKQTPTLRPGRHGDGGTLFLVVEPGSRSCHWVQRFTVDGNRRDVGLGGYPYVGLADARAAAFANRQVARRGGDPTAAVRPSRVPTFRTACERVESAADWKGLGLENRLGPWSAAGGRSEPAQSGRLVFPAPTRAGKAIHATTLAHVRRPLFGNRCTLHGFRSSFRDWASEQTSAPHAVAEAVFGAPGRERRRATVRPV